MKTKGLTRGEILVGMEQGLFKVGDKFEDNDKERVAEIVANGHGSVYVNIGSKPALFRTFPNETWDLIKEPQFKVDDVLVHPMEGVITVYKVIGSMVYFHTDKKTDWFNILNEWVTNGSIRHATEEEITSEEKRRFWNKLNRQVDEYKAGDIVVGSANDLMEVVEVNGEILKCSQFHPYDQHFMYFNVSKEQVTLISSFEQRLDLK